jgi:uncharacterized protein (DUF1330 family)
MSAYVVIEASVRDEESRDRYASQVGPILQKFAADVVSFGPWQLLFGEPAFENGMIIRFPDKKAALAWYHFPDYQALLDVRAAGLDCRFRLVG